MKLSFAAIGFLVSAAWAMPTMQHTPPSQKLTKRGGSYPPAHEDPFYHKPDNLEDMELGEVFRSRYVPKESSTVSWGQDHKMWQVMYRTSDFYLRPSWTAVTIVEPIVKKEPLKIVSDQFFEDSVNFDCSPSYSLVSSDAPDGMAGAGADVPILGDLVLEQGYAYIMADHEGPNSSFISGHTSGRATLDGMKAAINFMKYPNDTEIAMWGYSGGAHASAWASFLYEKYAPELNIVGAAYGGLPGDLNYIIDKIDATVFSGFVLGGWTGAINGAYDYAAEFYSWIQQSWLDDMSKARTYGNCEDQLLFGFFLKNYTAQFKNDKYEKEHNGELIWTLPLLKNYIANESMILEKNPQTGHELNPPPFPLYIIHSSGDEIMPFEATKLNVEQSCARGAKITFDTFPETPEHSVTEIASAPQGFKWILQALNGTLPEVECGSGTPGGPLSLLSPGILEWLGYREVVSLLKEYNLRVSTGGLFGKVINYLKTHNDFTPTDVGNPDYLSDLSKMAVNIPQVISKWPADAIQNAMKDFPELFK